MQLLLNILFNFIKKNVYTVYIYMDMYLYAAYAYTLISYILQNINTNI